MSEGAPPDIEVIPVGRDTYQVSSDRGRRLGYAAASGTITWVFLDGLVHEVSAAPTAATAPTRHDDEAALSAPMPATVAHINVEPGEQVEAGQTLLVLEAMKMELPITAPRRGIIATIACRVGDLVAPGVPLVEMA